MTIIKALALRQQRQSRCSISAQSVVLLASACLLTACAGVFRKPSAEMPGKPVVTVQIVKPRVLPMPLDVSGLTAATTVAHVRPQVSGIVQSRKFKEDSEVKSGELLYQLDPAGYRAKVKSALAVVAEAEKRVLSVKRKVRWSKDLVEVGAAFDDSVDAALLEAQAGLTSAKASLRVAGANLAATRITSPITGRIGKSTVEVGAAVTANQASSLATVSKLDTMYVPIPMKGLTSAALSALRDGRSRVRLLLDDGAVYPLGGKIVLPAAKASLPGEVAVARAEFPNPRAELLPGRTVRVTIEADGAAETILVPQSAVGFDSAGTPVALVVGSDGRVAQRMLATGRVVGSLVSITSGLQSGDQLVVAHDSKATPGAAVQVVLDASTPGTNATD